MPSYLAAFDDAHWDITVRALTDSPSKLARLIELMDYKPRLAPFGAASAVAALVARGSLDEDIPEENVVFHFHEPFHNDGFFLRFARCGFTNTAFQSSMEHAQADLPLNSVGWPSAVDDLYASFANETAAARTTAANRAFNMVGRVMHLLQDAASPYHTRNDTHHERHNNPCSGRKALDHIIVTGAFVDRLPTVYPPRSSGGLALPLTVTSVRGLPSPISNLWDVDEYSPFSDFLPGCEIRPQVAGLAELSAAHAFSAQTTPFYPPNPPCPNPDNAPLVACERDPAGKKYCTYESVAGFSYKLREGLFGYIYDAEAARFSAERLVPYAIGYGEALFDYFVRGIVQPNGRPSVSVRFEGRDLIVTNEGPDDWGGGRLELFTGDGKEPTLHEYDALDNVVLARGAELRLDSPSETQSYTIVYRGRLGADADGVAAFVCRCSNEACDDTCVPCGNGRIDPGEQCDPGGEDSAAQCGVENCGSADTDDACMCLTRCLDAEVDPTRPLAGDNVSHPAILPYLPQCIASESGSGAEGTSGLCPNNLTCLPTRSESSESCDCYASVDLVASAAGNACSGSRAGTVYYLSDPYDYPNRRHYGLDVLVGFDGFPPQEDTLSIVVNQSIDGCLPDLPEPPGPGFNDAWNLKEWPCEGRYCYANREGFLHNPDGFTPAWTDYMQWIPFDNETLYDGYASVLDYPAVITIRRTFDTFYAASIPYRTSAPTATVRATPTQTVHTPTPFPTPVPPASTCGDGAYSSNVEACDASAAGSQTCLRDECLSDCTCATTLTLKGQVFWPTSDRCLPCGIWLRVGKWTFQSSSTNELSRKTRYGFDCEGCRVVAGADHTTPCTASEDVTLEVTNDDMEVRTTYSMYAAGRSSNDLPCYIAVYGVLDGIRTGTENDFLEAVNLSEVARRPEHNAPIDGSCWYGDPHLFCQDQP